MNKEVQIYEIDGPVAVRTSGALLKWLVSRGRCWSVYFRTEFKPRCVCDRIASGKACVCPDRNAAGPQTRMHAHAHFQVCDTKIVEAGFKNYSMNQFRY